MGDTTDWNPGNGWREVPINSDPGYDREYIRKYGHDRVLEGMWVREAPVPALPTEPGSTIRWQDGAYLPQLAQLDAGSSSLGWWAPDEHGDYRWMTPDELVVRVAGAMWELLEPRAATAKAVLDRVRQSVNVSGPVATMLAEIGTDFGVTS